MDQNTPDAVGTPSAAPCPGAATAAAPDGNAACAPAAGKKVFGKPNYSKTAVAIWAVLLFVTVCILTFYNPYKIRRAKAESLIWEASRLFDQQRFAESTELLRQAAELGNATAQAYYAGSLKMGYGVEQDFVGAVRWYRKAAAQKYPYAFYELGLCYQHGLGVDRDLDQAEAWYRKAYEGGIQEYSRKALDEIAATREREASASRPF